MIHFELYKTCSTFPAFYSVVTSPIIFWLTLTQTVPPVCSPTSMFIIQDKGGGIPGVYIHTSRYPVVISRKVYSIGTLRQNNYFLLLHMNAKTALFTSYLFLKNLSVELLYWQGSASTWFRSGAGQTCICCPSAFDVFIQMWNMFILSVCDWITLNLGSWYKACSIKPTQVEPMSTVEQVHPYSMWNKWPNGFKLVEWNSSLFCPRKPDDLVEIEAHSSVTSV